MRHLALLGVAPAQGAQRLPRLEVAEQIRQLVPLAAGLAGVLLAQPVEPALHDAQVGQHQLGVELAQVAQRLRRGAIHPGEGPHHQAERVHVGQRAERLGVHALPARPGQVDEADLRVGHLARTVEGRQLIDAPVRHLDRPEVQVRVAGLVQRGDGVEQRGLARERKTHQAGFHGALALMAGPPSRFRHSPAAPGKRNTRFHQASRSPRAMGKPPLPLYRGCAPGGKGRGRGSP